jgi:hypothetical protein
MAFGDQKDIPLIRKAGTRLSEGSRILCRGSIMELSEGFQEGPTRQQTIRKRIVLAEENASLRIVKAQPRL